MSQIIFRPRLVIPALALLCGLIAAPLSLSHWGYLFVPPSPTAVTAPLHEIDSIHLVQFDPEYHASVIPIMQLPQDTFADYPPSRILPLLQDRLDQAVLSAPLDADFIERLAAALRGEQVQLGPPRPEYLPQPSYCVTDLAGLQCFEDPGLLPPDLMYSFYTGVQMQPNGNITVTWPVFEASDGIVTLSGKTETHTFTSEDKDFYHYLLPAGFIVQGRDQDGKPVMLTNLESRGSGDHYRYYEFLFDVDQSGLQLRAGTRYQFDIAGLEGFTFPIIALGLFVPLFLAWLILLLLWRVFGSIIRLIESSRSFA